MALWIVGDGQDPSAAYVRRLAEQRGIEVVGLDEARFGVDWWFESAPSGALAVIRRERGALPLGAATGAFVRLHPAPTVPPELDLPLESHPLYVRERRAALHFFLDALPPPVVNRPSSGRSNGSKPFQMARLAAAGFQVPRWAATNDPALARRFVAGCRDGAIAKSCSGLRSHVRRFDAGTAERLMEGTAPVVLQAYVGGHEVRLHVLGARAFAAAVHADTVDYRFDGDAVAFRATEAPADLVRRCQAFAAAEGLAFAGFDFRIDAAGGWWALEMNPVPTFLPYEGGTGHSIGSAIVDVLGDEVAAPTR
jgi:hypothetical protein